jgi:hypothetical protein
MSQPNRRKAMKFAVLASAMLALVMTTSAHAQMLGFQTPSGNIHCQADNYDDEWLRCDMKVQDRVPPRPRNCDDDWGGAFAIDRHRASGICHTDTVISESLPILPYGATWKGFSFTCLSTPVGLTCTNRKGRGFTLSRAAQKIF